MLFFCLSSGVGTILNKLQVHTGSRCSVNVFTEVLDLINLLICSVDEGALSLHQVQRLSLVFPVFSIFVCFCLNPEISVTGTESLQRNF